MTTRWITPGEHLNIMWSSTSVHEERTGERPSQAPLCGEIIALLAERPGAARAVPYRQLEMGESAICLACSPAAKRTQNPASVSRLNRRHLIGSMGQVGAARDNATIDSITGDPSSEPLEALSSGVRIATLDGVHRLFEEKQSGARHDDRTAPAEMIAYARKPRSFTVVERWA